MLYDCTLMEKKKRKKKTLWVDVKIYVICHFSNLFTYLESCSLLDSDDEIHLFALHFIFLPHINLMLQELMKTWNNHPLRTEKNSSPLQS